MANDMYEQIIQEITNELGLDAETAAEFLDSYLVQLPDEISNLKKTIENNDLTTGASLAHSMKGASGNLRIMPIHKAAAELEQALKNSQADTASQMILELETLAASLAKP